MQWFMRKKDDSGKFIKIEDDLIRTGIRLKRSHISDLKKLCKEGETVSDKVREAIAYYLKEKGNHGK